jgi:hypothetical protein
VFWSLNFSNASIIKKLPGGIGLGVFFRTISFVFYLNNSICYDGVVKGSYAQAENPNVKIQMPNNLSFKHWKFYL